jgi:MFS family permease
LSATLVAPEGRTLQFLLLTFASLVAAFSRFTVSPLQESMRVSLAFSDNQMALLQGPALALPMVLASIPLGLLIDRCSRVRLLIIFAVLDLAGSLFTALASSFPVLFAARCLVGLAVAGVGTTTYSLLADLYEPAQRGRASMVVVVGQYAGMSAAFALGGVLLTRSGKGVDGWQWAMLWMTGPMLLVIFSTLPMREPPRTGVAIENPTIRQALAEAWRHRLVIGPLMVGSVMAEMAVLAALTWASPALARDFALTPAQIGTIMAMTVLVSGVVGPVAGGFLADLCQRTGGPRRTLLALSGLALLSAPLGLFSVVSGVTSASVLLVVFMTVIGAILVVGIALFTIVIPNEVRGLCIAVLAGTQVLFAVALAPVTVSLLSSVLGGPAMIGKALAVVCVTVGVLGAAAFMFGRRYFAKFEPALA